MKPLDQFCSWRAVFERIPIGEANRMTVDEFVRYHGGSRDTVAQKLRVAARRGLVRVDRSQRTFRYWRVE